MERAVLDIIDEFNIILDDPNDKYLLDQDGYFSSSV